MTPSACTELTQVVPLVLLPAMTDATRYFTFTKAGLTRPLPSYAPSDRIKAQEEAFQVIYIAVSPEIRARIADCGKSSKALQLIASVYG